MYKWILTNINERKSYFITNETLLGEKNYSDIKLWRTNITENDIRFKVKQDRYVSLRLLRKDVKDINLKVHGRPLPKYMNNICLFDGNFLTIETYLFILTKIKINENTNDEDILRKATKKAVLKYRSLNVKTNEKPVAKVKPNNPALTGKYQNGEMIDTNMFE